MARRRSNNEGTLFKDDKRDLWIAEISLPDGKRKRKTSKNLEVVKTWLLTQRSNLRDGLMVENEQITVSEFLNRWLNDVAQYSLRPSTLETYRTLIRVHINQAIGGIKISQLRPDQLQFFYAEKIRSGLSKRTVQFIHSILRRAFKQAVKWKLAARNITEAVEAPVPDKKQVVPLTKQQIVSFLAVLTEDRLFPLYVIALGCGLRRGELLALSWDNIDLDNGYIYVTRSLQYIKGKIVIGEPKSAKSKRMVAIPDFVSVTLKRHRELNFGRSEFVFATSNGTPFMPRNIVRHFKATLKKAGLPEETRLHDLRHTFISYLLALGTPPKDVQEIAGHSSYSVTMDIYGHMLPGAQKEAAEKINSIFKV